jgi:hypothetical protein
VLYFSLFVIALLLDYHLRNELHYAVCALSHIEVEDIDEPQVQCVAQDGQQTPVSLRISQYIYGCTMLILPTENIMSKGPWCDTRYAYPILVVTLPFSMLGQLMERYRFHSRLVSVTSRRWMHYLLHVQTVMVTTTRAEHSCLTPNTSQLFYQTQLHTYAYSDVYDNQRRSLGLSRSETSRGRRQLPHRCMQNLCSQCLWPAGFDIQIRHPAVLLQAKNPAPRERILILP